MLLLSGGSRYCVSTHGNKIWMMRKRWLTELFSVYNHYQNSQASLLVMQIRRCQGWCCAQSTQESSRLDVIIEAK
ncbi:hypothetical protein MKW98_003200 [Papaver atlanticum]|uniref:Uncharacterized protein n=1 Tax=Papaver atlanticum TaxID=357466 RepID=A0AAD4XWQ3_9MAGN|nr:hypothetical protein MKW98_003200 [Papaver atlanticum]